MTSNGTSGKTGRRLAPVPFSSTDGTQGKQRIEYLQPGDDTDILFPGDDTDGIYPPDPNDKRVLKIVDDATAVIREDGKVEVTVPSIKGRIGQRLKGGFKDEGWIKDKKWPTPWDKNECNKEKKKENNLTSNSDNVKSNREKKND